MKVSTQINIKQPKERVWAAITDIEHCQQMISAIIDLKILNQPENQLVGLKWQETRLMFGKEAVETMWITDAVNNQYYRTRAESHGSIYITELRLEDDTDESTKLIMTFSAEAQSFFMRCLSMLMTPLMKGAMIKMLDKDLLDIKNFLDS